METIKINITVPIYLANIVLLKKEKIGVNQKLIGEILLKNILVKGFTKKQIAKICEKEIFRKALYETKLGKDQYFEIKEIELLSQHGQGFKE
jgi:hypothetical protein